ncbi:hypothetical protein CASFOL_028228 [Castilleja foliolosa]|uniref:Uncharacterized protein n=1 Tax=Castilleja foliolosa TaxID=1961234 RepID=A0ABD3CE00_9LAMI
MVVFRIALKLLQIDEEIYIFEVYFSSYEAVSSNISGSTPKDLFGYVVEELRKEYDEDNAHIKEALKQEKITVASTWNFEEFKSSIEESIGSLSISDINLQLVYENLIGRAKEKEEKEAKKRKRLEDHQISILEEVTNVYTSEFERFIDFIRGGFHEFPLFISADDAGTLTPSVSAGETHEVTLTVEPENSYIAWDFSLAQGKMSVVHAILIARENKGKERKREEEKCYLLQSCQLQTA